MSNLEQKTIYTLEISDYERSDVVAVTDLPILAKKWQEIIGLVTELKINAPVDLDNLPDYVKEERNSDLFECIKRFNKFLADSI